MKFIPKFRSETLRQDITNALFDSAIITLGCLLYSTHDPNYTFKNQSNHSNLPISARMYDVNSNGILEANESEVLFRDYKLEKIHPDQASSK